MVLAFEESCRADIEQEYGSIVEFKRYVHKAVSIFNQDQMQQALEAIYEALRKCAEAIIEGIKKLAESLTEALTEALQPVIQNIRELTMELYDMNGFIPLNEDICIAPIPKHAPVMQFNKVPMNYSMNIRTPQIPYRCRSNC